MIFNSLLAFLSVELFILREDPIGRFLLLPFNHKGLGNNKAVSLLVNSIILSVSSLVYLSVYN